jgi:hypothetical protein
VPGLAADIDTATHLADDAVPERQARTRADADLLRGEERMKIRSMIAAVMPMPRSVTISG